MKMFKLLGIFATALAGTLAVQSANAGEIKEGAVVCLSQKYLDKYETLREKEAYGFMDQMEDRVQCLVKKTPQEVIKIGVVGAHIQVETLDGFKLWLNMNDYTDVVSTKDDSDTDITE